MGSATNNTTRNLGSVLGVAVLGSIAATCYARGMAVLPAVPRPAAAAARDSIASATQVIRALRAAHAAHAAQALRAAAGQAFVHGASLGALGTAALTLGTAAVAARFLPAFPVAQIQPDPAALANPDPAALANPYPAALANPDPDAAEPGG
jgi:hypothetical protein